MVISTSTPAVGRRGVRAKEGPKRRETNGTTAVCMRVEVRQMVRSCYGGLDGVVTRAFPTGRVSVTRCLVVVGSTTRFRVSSFLRLGVPREACQAPTVAATTSDVGRVPGVQVRAFSATAVRVVVKEAAVLVPCSVGV